MDGLSLWREITRAKMLVREACVMEAEIIQAITFVASVAPNVKEM